ncbi:ubiquitin-conjugating enzyme 25 [Tanacetum coccineum]
MDIMEQSWHMDKLGTILNEKPYFNEPGYEQTRGSNNGDNKSSQYNEYTIIYSLKTMVYTMKKPHKHFEDLAIGYFHYHARDILKTCKAYIKGLKVGCDIDSGEETGGKVLEVLKNWPERSIQVIVVIECERILGLGDLGFNDPQSNYFAFRKANVSDVHLNDVGGALDRLHYAHNPCLQFDRDGKFWVYLHSQRDEVDIGDDGTFIYKEVEEAKQ